jgi:nitroimidazol reductase NimA-like FMN-containing flavoprotein (pyridoxamine 5'-phosphate oxidase superfamily)
MSVDRFELPQWECFELARTAPFGRLCITDSGTPIALPINFRFTNPDEGTEVVIRTAASTIIGNYEGPASLEIDSIDLDANDAWSVLIRGTLRRVRGEHQLVDPKPLLDDRHLWMVLKVSAISGRRFTVRRAADGYSVEWSISG